jgi:tetratricopeptide (TPR) repeat protein
MNTTCKTVRHASLLCVLGSAFALVGCAGHGNYTTEKISTAKEKMEMMKSGTEWEMARQSFLAGDLDKALKAVDRSIAMNPQVAKSQVLRGRIMFEKGDMEHALESLQKAQAIDPNLADARYFAGLAYERLSQKEKALEQYQKAAELEPSNAQYTTVSAEMLIDLDRLDEAREFLESRSGTFEHNAAVRQVLGHIALMKNDPKTAVTLFDEARLLAPEDMPILEDLARAQIKVEQWGDAEANLAKLLTSSEYKARRDLLHLRARALTALDRKLEAREILITLTDGQAGQNDVEAWIALGQLSYTMKDANRLRQASGRVMAVAPNRSEGYVLRALMLRRSGDFKGAEDMINRALERKQDPEAYVLLGLIQQDQKQFNEARESFAKALKLDPASPEASQAMASVPTE